MTFDDAPDWIDDWATDRDSRADLAAEVLADTGDTGDDQAWTIDDDDAANWALRKIGRAEAELRRLTDVAQHEQAAITAWLTEASTGPQRTIGFFTSKLVDYRRRLEDDTPDLPATYKLPGGDLTRRAGRAQATVTDTDGFLAWALVNAPDAVKMTPLVSPIVREARFEVTETGQVVEVATGEVIPGFVVRSGPPVYAVRTR